MSVTIRDTVRQTMNGNLREDRVADVCERSIVNDPRFLLYLPPGINVSRWLASVIYAKIGSLTPIAWYWSPKAFSAATENKLPMIPPNTPAVLPIITPSTPKTSGGDGRVYSVIHPCC